MDQFLNQLNPDNVLDDLVQKSVGDMVKKVMGNGPGGKINGFVDKIF